MRITRLIWEEGKKAEHLDSSNTAINQYVDSINEIIQPKPEEHILDLGCGSGMVTNALQRKSGAYFTGADFSIKLLTKANETNPSINWIHQDALEKWKLPDKEFDKIYSFSFLQYIPPSGLRFVLEESLRTLKPGGVIYHLDIPDKQKFRHRFNDYKRLLVLGPVSYLTNRVFFKDNSYWHSPKYIESILANLGLNCEFLESHCPYRSHFIVNT